ncbi:MAG: Clostripain family protein [Lachnospiraceae bacterium]|nr:Clostripain family protein [Lachnospiraceae bacterium]
MKRKLLAILLSGVLSVSMLTACDDSDWSDESYIETDDEYVEETETTEPEETEEQSNVDLRSAGAIRGLKMSVAQNSGELTIKRAESNVEPIKGDDGVWTIFIYMCGTDLESFNGMGTADFEEMAKAESSENVRFIVQTGGTSQWRNEFVDSSKIQRYMVKGAQKELVNETSEAAMGNSDTLADFIQWGTQNYASEHMGLIFWNHGGGSISGVCFDENNDGDSLSLAEIDDGLYKGYEVSGRKFDFIGFDACLMGTIETANILATYADYMYGSEETEPGSGWDYTAIGSYLASNTSANGADLGKVVCDSFLACCAAQKDDALTTLSVIDLSKVDDFLVSFNDFSKEIYEATEDASVRAKLVRGIEAADNFGGNDKSEGYTNMVDMGGIIEAGSVASSKAADVRKNLDSLVVYNVTGSTHQGASGMAMYYPLGIEGSNELSTFGQVCVSPYYLALVDRQGQYGAGKLSDNGYDEAELFDEDGDWNFGNEDDDHWDYMDEYEPTGESSHITFEQAPYIDDDGVYTFQLDDAGYNNTADVCALIYEILDDESAMIELGETIDVDSDWDNGIFKDNFDGYWLSLPDGQNLATYIVDITDEYVVYTSPIMLNGKDTNLRFYQYFEDGSVVIEGAWDGIDENGAASRDIIKLQKGDKIVPLYYAYSLNSEDEYTYEGNEYTVSGTPEINYSLMISGDYMYAFCIDDIYGDYLVTDTVTFNVDENGELSFYIEEDE